MLFSRMLRIDLSPGLHEEKSPELRAYSEFCYIELIEAVIPGDSVA